MLAIQQPDGPPPPPEVLGPIMTELDRLDTDMRTAGVWIFTAGLTPAPGTPTEADVAAVFTREYGRAVAILIRVLGDIDLAEDAVQDAFTEAVRRWPADGLPVLSGSPWRRSLRSGGRGRSATRPAPPGSTGWNCSSGCSSPRWAWRWCRASTAAAVRGCACDARAPVTR
ncbi:RNA polymerase sigma-70 factor, ECF subfamily [Pseudonocardia sp. N23]|nr:RNA polymerase sigma-70 factor, ECF subfamily [Pseudonocardia sp. N23]